MKLSTTISLLSATAVLGAGSLMAQPGAQALISQPAGIQPAYCGSSQKVVQTKAVISADLANYSAYKLNLQQHTVRQYGDTADNKGFYTSLPLGTCKVCREAVLTVHVRRQSTGNLTDNDWLHVGVARAGSTQPLKSIQLWSPNVGLTKTITVTLSASDLNDIIFKSNGIGYLNLYLQDDTGVDSVELAYVN